MHTNNSAPIRQLLDKIANGITSPHVDQYTSAINALSDLEDNHPEIAERIRSNSQEDKDMAKVVKQVQQELPGMENEVGGDADSPPSTGTGTRNDGCKIDILRKELIKNVPPAHINTSGDRSQFPFPHSGYTLRQASDLPKEEAAWPGFPSRGRVGGVGGDGGSGKSTDLRARLVEASERGKKSIWLLADQPPGNAADGITQLGFRITPNVESNIAIVDFDDRKKFKCREDFKKSLEDEKKRLGGLDVLVIDPALKFIQRIWHEENAGALKIDSESEHVYKLTDRLRGLAASLDCAIMCIFHHGKGGDSRFTLPHHNTLVGECDVAAVYFTAGGNYATVPSNIKKAYEARLADGNENWRLVRIIKNRNAHTDPEYQPGFYMSLIECGKIQRERVSWQGNATPDHKTRILSALKRLKKNPPTARSNIYKEAGIRAEDGKEALDDLVSEHKVLSPMQACKAYTLPSHCVDCEAYHEDN